MVATPAIVPGNGEDALLKRVMALEQTVKAIGNKTLFSASIGAGGITINGGQIDVNNGAGAHFFNVSPTGFVDGSGRQISGVTIADYLNNVIFGEAPTTVVGNVATNWYWTMLDAAQNQIIASDGISGRGLAYPFENIAMYPTWNGLGTSTPGSYSQIAASLITANTAMWTGRIGYVSHPAISIEGIWGKASGTTSAVSYRLVVGATTFGPWTIAAGGGAVDAIHQFDIHTMVGSLDVPVQLFAQASITSADSIACQVLGCHIRQTPAVFG